MKKYLLILTLLIAGSFSGLAQEDETDPRMGKLQEKMQQYIQKRLNMTKAESEKFSPIFIRYITELRKVHVENRTDRPMQQLKVAEVRVRFRDEFRQVMDEKRANRVFIVEKEFLEIAKREILERKIQNRQGGGGLRRNKLMTN
jgi:predicted NodU family carbamoyl transferase